MYKLKQKENEIPTTKKKPKKKRIPKPISSRFKIETNTIKKETRLQSITRRNSSIEDYITTLKVCRVFNQGESRRDIHRLTERRLDYVY